MIYFDNAATSWPKPPGVAEAMVRFMQEVGANPDRAAHRRAIDAGRIVYEACELELDGVEVTVVGCSPQGVLHSADVEAAIQPRSQNRLPKSLSS
jgi:cysteine sulfinate desulfinase/cysteine desulfurase-like protein